MSLTDYVDVENLHLLVVLLYKSSIMRNFLHVNKWETQQLICWNYSLLEQISSENTRHQVAIAATKMMQEDRVALLTPTYNPYI